MKDTWLKINGADSEQIQSSLSELKSKRIEEGKYSENDCKVVAAMNMSIIKEKLNVDELVLERLRHMASLWDVDFRVQDISSHRKFIGPVIVSFKKLFFPLIRFAMKDFIRQQRDFNAATIRLVGQISNKNK